MDIAITKRVLAASTVALLAGVLACGGGGGGGGSGSSTASTVSGNVSNQSTAMLERAPATRLARLWQWLNPVGDAYAGRKGIHVSINGVETDTDANGFFALTGPFDGTVTVSFGSGNRTFTLQVNVPPGGTVILRDVDLRNDGTAHESARGFRLRGTVQAVDCAADSLTVAMASGSATVALDSATRIQIPGGGKANDTCANLALAIGQRVRVQGDGTQGGVLLADRVIVQPDAEEDSIEDEIEFRGTVSSLSCPGSIVVDRDDGESVTVTLGGSTELDTVCTGLDGLHVKVEGTLQSDGSVAAREVEVD